MLSQVQQCLASGFLFLFGVLALQVSRRAGPARRDRATLAWRVTAAYFLVGGGYSLGHAMFSAAAIAAGKDSALLAWVGSWAIAANLARGAMAVVFGAMLLALMLGRRRWVFHLAQSALLQLSLVAVAATAVCLLINVRTEFGLSTGLAILSMLTAVVMMGALLAAVLKDGMDQLLWLALALYALKETMSVSQMAVIAFWTVAPHVEVYYFFYGGSVVLGAGMCAFAVRRLRLADRGRRVPALFERLHALRRSPVS